MRFFALSLSGLLAVSASVIPVSRAYPALSVRQNEITELPSQIEGTVAQAVYISQNLNSEIERIKSDVSKDPLLKLSPINYNIIAELGSAFNAATTGIEALPTLTPDDNIPQYVADHYAPLVRVLTESVFLTLLDLKRYTIQTTQNPILIGLGQLLDSNIYTYVLAMNAKFQGFACGLSKAAGAGTPAGQALEVISEQLLYNLVDSVAKGQC